MRTVNLSLIVVLVFANSHAFAQSALGALLDAGAQKLTVEEFKAELMQRSLVGPTGTGISVEVMYTSAGRISGTSVTAFRGPGATLDGEWKADDEGRICAIMQIEISRGPQVNQLAPRCQFWFKLGDTYYLSDSDSDRYAKILPRKLK